MKLSGTPSFVLIFACAVVTPLLVTGAFSLIPPSWTTNGLSLAFVLFAINLIVVGMVTFVGIFGTSIFGLHQVLMFSITALIATRGKQLLLSTPKEVGIMEAGTLLIVCLLVFCVTLYMQRKKQD